MSKLCLKYNVPSLYRKAIYKMIDSQYDCDWYFGHTEAGIKEMDTSELKNVKHYNVIGNTSRAFCRAIAACIPIKSTIVKESYTNAH